MFELEGINWKESNVPSCRQQIQVPDLAVFPKFYDIVWETEAYAFILMYCITCYLLEIKYV